VRGRLDLLLRAENGSPRDVELVDFKTAANRPPSAVHENQLRMYAEALRIVGLHPVRLIIYDLDADNGRAIYVEQTEGKVAAFRDRLRRWIDDICEGRFPRRPHPRRCRSCDFAELCRAVDH